MRGLKRSVAASLVLASVGAMATNGDNMIGFGAKSMALGGTGIAMPMGPESVLKNPALITQTKNRFEFLFAGTYFSPDVKTKAEGATEKQSEADKFMIPSIGLVHNIAPNFYFGLGAYGTSGLGVDYRGTTADDDLFKMSTSLTLMKFMPTVAYKNENFSVGVGLAIQYGSLGISYDNGADVAGAGVPIGGQGNGTSDDLGTGFDIGLGYNWDKLSLGLNYQSEIEMEYKHQIKNAAADFGLTTGFTDKLTQPAEYGVGLAYDFGSLKTTFDYKIIKWEDADGYKEFGWEDQNIFAVGVAYALERTTLRAGYNYGKSAVGDKALKTPDTHEARTIHLFNALGFPATIESHITLGAGHQFTDNFGMDFAFVHAPEVKETAQVRNGNFGGGMGDSNYTQDVTHSQSSYTLGGNWTF